MEIILKKYGKVAPVAFAVIFFSVILFILLAKPAYAAADKTLVLPKNSFASPIASLANDFVASLQPYSHTMRNTFLGRRISVIGSVSKEKVEQAKSDAGELALPKKGSLAAASLAAVSSFTDVLSAAISGSIRDIVNSFRTDSPDVSASAPSGPATATENANAANDSASAPPASPEDNSPALAEDVVRPKNGTDGSNQDTSQASRPATQNIVERVEKQSIISAGGISEDALNQRLEQFYNKLTSQMSALTSAQNTQSAQTYQVVSQTNRINQLSSVAISGATITGSSYTGEISATGNTSLANATSTSIFSTTASSTNLFSQTASFGSLNISGLTTLINGFLSNASSTITSGLFSMNGGASTTNITASGTGYFGLGQFTNTSGTTTVASGQGLTVGSSQFVVQQGSGNIGIGTTSPSTNLGIVGSQYLTGGLGVGTLNTSAGTLRTSGNVTVGGTLAVNGGLTTLGAASTTLFSSFGPAYFGGSATTTIDSSGNLAVAGTLGITGNTTLANATSTSIFSTTASSTNLFSQTASFGSLSISGLTTLINGFLSNASSTITSGLFSMNGGASTTNLTASGTGFFGTATSTNLYANTASLGSLTLATPLAVASGGTGQTSFGQGWLSSNGTTLSASTSPTVNYLVATSTTATSTFAAGLQSTYLNITGTAATSTFANGIQLSGGTLTVSGGGTGLAQLTSGILSASSTLSVAYGGTGASTLTGILKGNGASAFAAAVAGTDYAAPGTASSWSALQQFQSGASTTLFSSYGPAYFGGSATSSFSSAGVLTLTSALAIGSGGTGQTSFGQGWLSSNGTTLSASTSPTINYLVATSTTVASIFPYASTTALTASGNGYFGTTTITNLAVTNTSTSTFAGPISNTSGALTIAANGITNNILLNPYGGNVGVGTTTPFRALSIAGAVSTAQQAIAYDTGNYTDILTSSVGDLFVYPSGNDALFNNSNLWVCTGGSGNTNGCPSGTPSGFGNLIVETKFGVASSTPWAAISVGANGAIVTTEKSLTDGATIAIDWTQGNQQLVTLGGNRTITFSNYIPGQTLRFVVCQDATGSRTLSWPAVVLWGGGTAPTLTTTANKCDVTTFITTSATGTIRILGSSVLNF